MRLMYSCLTPFLLVAPLFLSGCGSGREASNRPPAVPVSGTVTLDGKPLAFASVTFYPQEGMVGNEGFGVTDESGKFQMKQAGGEEGVSAGTYKVTINHYIGPGGKPIAMTKDSPPPADQGAVESLPERYSSLIATTLSATVPPEGGTINFDMKSK